MPSAKGIALLEPMTELRQHWLDALDASTAALEAASRAHILAAEENRAHWRRIAADRTWLETVDWSAVDAVREGTLTVLPASRKRPQLRVVKPAA
jgi:hypothetical protein